MKYSYDEQIRIMTDEALDSLMNKPVRSTTIERIKLFRYADENIALGLSQPLRYGHCLKFVLENVSVPLFEHDLIAGRQTEKVLDDDEEALYRELLTKEGYESCRPSFVRDNGHCSFYWKDTVKYGIYGLLEKARREYDRRCKEGADKDTLEFLEGAILLYEAHLIFIKRYADKAREMGMDELANVCSALLEREPRTFREALQLIWFIAFIYCAYLASNPTLTLGRLDYFLEELYERDIKEGRITREEAFLLITDFYCKNNLIMGRGEHQLSGDDENISTGWARNLCYDAPQYLPLSGRREDGSVIAGALTELFVEAIVPRFKNPVIDFYYSPDFMQDHPDLWKKVVSKMRESASLMVYNESNNISSNLRSGVDREDAIEFEHFGCNHPTLPGKEYVIWFSGMYFPRYMERCVRELAEAGREPESIEEIYDALLKIIEGRALEIVLGSNQKYEEVVSKKPGPIYVIDLFYKESIERARSHKSGGCKYICTNIMPTAYASFIDMICVIDEVIIKSKKITLKRLVEAMDANFEGYAYERALCLSAPKLGSDDERANKHAHDFLIRYTDFVDNIVREKAIKPEYPRLVFRHSLTTDNGHISMGRNMGATPEGRLAGVPFSQNTAPAVGSSVNGLTARLCSMASLPFERILTGAQNISIQKNAFRGEAGLGNLAAVIGGYFDMGGLQVQVSAVSVDELREAQKHPELHRDITVRITGYSAIFVDLSLSAQNEIIRREEMSF